MDQLLRDVRFGVRTLVKNRWFSLLAIATLGLGIGANTAIFSVIDGVLLKPLPYANGDRLLLVRESAPLAGRPQVGVSVAELYDYRAQTRAFDALVEYHQMNFDLLKRGEPDRVSTGVVSHDFFNVLGIKPLLGRTFVEHDDALGADAVLVLSYTYWQSKFGGDPHIVGQVFEMNDRPHTVIGVLPNVPHYPQENDVYMPVSACPFRANAERTLAQANGRRNFTLTVFGRLKREVTEAQATRDVDVICSRFVKDDPKTYRPGSGFTASTLPVRDALTSQARPMLLILLATTGFVLIIACANVANLTLARLLRRDRELAVRTALGAGRSQLVRQLLTESVLLSLAGGVVGLAFASSTMEMLTTFVGRFTARTGEIGIDPWVLGFTLLVSIVTGIAFGTVPALSSRVDLRQHDETGRARRHLVEQAPPAARPHRRAGFGVGRPARRRRAAAGELRPAAAGRAGLSRRSRAVGAGVSELLRYPNPGDHLRFYERAALERLKAEPGVISAAVTDAVPLFGTGNPFNIPFVVEGHATDNPDKRPNTDLRTISPDYFKTLGIPLVAGRVFTDGDRRGGPRVVVVDQAMLRHFDGKSPIGSRITIGNPPAGAEPVWSTIVGVVGDVRGFALNQPSVAQVYQPLSQSSGLAGRFLIRTRAIRSWRRRCCETTCTPSIPTCRSSTCARSTTCANAISRRRSSPPCCSRDLRGPGVAGDHGGADRRHRRIGHAADAGVRSANGARREPEPSDERRHRPRTRTRRNRPDHRCRRVLRAHAGAVDLPVRHPSHRSDHVRSRRRRVRGGGHRRVCGPGVAGDDGRSDGRAESGLNQ